VSCFTVVPFLAWYRDRLECPLGAAAGGRHSTISVVRTIRVVYRKYDESLHWHMTMTYLGEDEHGVWAGMRPGGLMTKGDAPPVTLPCANAVLFPRADWWTAWFNGAPHQVTVYCDVTTPPTWPEPNIVTMVDLDLDVIRHRADGSVEVVDEDEFEDHRVRLAYPPDVVTAATATASQLTLLLSDGSEPFSSNYRRWLSMVED
jgi:protein associated with RNAse G/E